MENKLILILTDSVALPRKNANTSWEDTYIYKLKNKYRNCNIINVSLGGASISDIKNQVNYYKVLNPDIVILHCGIVDAAPRAYGRIEMAIIKKMRLFRLTKPFVRFLRKNRSHHYASPKKFENELRYIKDELSPNFFYSIGIIPALYDYEKKIPGITKSIVKYNSILKNESCYLSTQFLSKDSITSDYHHVNKKGLQYIFNLISNAIDKI